MWLLWMDMIEFRNTDGKLVACSWVAQCGEEPPALLAHVNAPHQISYRLSAAPASQRLNGGN